MLCSPHLQTGNSNRNSNKSLKVLISLVNLAWLRYFLTSRVFDPIASFTQLGQFQIVEAIAYCHGRGIFHRDIKDENVLINVKTGHIKLIDFGSGAFVEDEYTDYQGTKVYSPPEWVRYQRYNGWSLESWCLGVLLFIIISGEIPFETEEDILRCTPTLKRRRISLGRILLLCFDFSFLKNCLLLSNSILRLCRRSCTKPLNCLSEFHIST